MVELPSELKALAPAGLFLVFRLRLAYPTREFNLLPSKWVAAYTKEVFVIDDPLIRWAHFNKVVARWREVDTPDPRGMIERAKEFGMNYGAVASMTCETTRCLSYVLTARSDRPYSDDELSKIQSSLAIMHKQGDELTPNEVAALRLMRRGVKVKMISYELGISESAVKQRLANARRKVGAATTLQAIGIASGYGLI